MTRRNRRKAIVCAVMVLMLIGSAAYAAIQWTEAHAKSWVVGFPPLDAPLILAERDYFGPQRDGDGLRLTAVRFHFNDCSGLERSGGHLTRIHVYIQDRTFPHLPITDKALSPMYGCDAARYTPGLHGRDRGGMRVVIVGHVRIRDWPDKNPVFVHDLCWNNGC